MAHLDLFPIVNIRNIACVYELADRYHGRYIRQSSRGENLGCCQREDRHDY